MLKNLKKFFRSSYTPLNTIVISRKNLLHNYRYISSINPSIKIAPVVKSNGYGHGIAIVGKVFDTVGAPFICVDSLFEAYQLHNSKIKTKILVMGSIAKENLSIKKLPFSYSVYDKEMLGTITKYQSHAGIHLFVDTGLHREGVLLDELPGFLEEIKKRKLNLEGLMSHFAETEKPKGELTREQIKNFAKAQEVVASFGLQPKFIHIAASGGILQSKNLDTKKLGNIARVGLSLYGVFPNETDINLAPALTLTTTITQLKDIKKGDTVGYSGTFTASSDMTIAVLPIGYNDGLDRRLSNKGVVIIDGQGRKILGKVSMNITTVDVTGMFNPFVGQKVIVYSNNPKDKNSIENSAKLCNDIAYDLLIHLNPATKRVIV